MSGPVEYEMAFRFRAADDDQAIRLYLAWGDTIKAEYNADPFSLRRVTPADNEGTERD